MLSLFYVVHQGRLFVEQVASSDSLWPPSYLVVKEKGEKETTQATIKKKKDGTQLQRQRPKTEGGRTKATKAK